jgi:hypothetical protein
VSRRRGLTTALLAAGFLAVGVDLDRPQATEAELAPRIELLRGRARDRLHADFAHLVEVHYRLRLGGVGLCDDEVAPVLGAAIAQGGDFLTNPWLAARLGGKWDEVEEAIGVGDDLTVLAVIEGSPADRAGLAVGDRIVSVDGDGTDKATDVFRRLRDSESGPPRIGVQRDEARLDLSLPRVEGCSHFPTVFVSTGADTMPHDDRHDLAIPTGLVTFSRDDDEIAIAIAHQMAHQLLGTKRPKRGEDEPPADRLGLFIAARAGFDVSKAPDFWERLTAEEPWKVDAKPTIGAYGFRLWHTAMALRAPVIRSTASEIAARIAAEQPLDP